MFQALLFILFILLPWLILFLYYFSFLLIYIYLWFFFTFPKHCYTFWKNKDVLTIFSKILQTILRLSVRESFTFP